MLKTAASLTPKEKYKNIGQTEAKKIVGLVSNYSARTKMKPVVQGLGTSRVSVLKFIKKFKNPTDVDKVVKAVQKHLNEGVDPGIQKKFMKANMQRDESGLVKNIHETTYASGAVSTKSIGVKGTMGDIGVKRGQIGFAQENKKPLNNPPAPKNPSGGIRPIGL